MIRVWSRLLLSTVWVGLLGSPVSQNAGAEMMHGDHNPRHGGYVLMYGENLHYEVVVTPRATLQIWLSGPMRDAVPPAVISDVAAEVEEPGGRRQPLKMSIDRAQGCWEGAGSAVKNAGATLHLAFKYQDEPVAITLPVAELLTHGRHTD